MRSPHFGAGVSGGVGGTAAPLLPFPLCEALTRAVWNRARAQAEAEAAVAAAGGAMAVATSPPLKRRRTVGPIDARERTQALIFPTCGATQPSQPQADEEPLIASFADEAVARARAALGATAAEQGGCVASAEGTAGEVLRRVRAMAVAAASYWREVPVDLSRAAICLARFLDQRRHLLWRRPPWRGVNLGGWLLLEPGPSAALFQEHGPSLSCEWDLLLAMRQKLGAEAASAALRAHRESFVTEEDIRRIAGLGLNAVRIPLGYWVVSGPAEGDIFMGPCLEYVDRALAWCKVHGLQVLLDLHGAPGGESGEKPCGRERRDWHWKEWRFDDSVAVLRRLAARYKGHPCVTGIAVCNEPSERVPAEALCHFYDRAVAAIREAGMPPDEVAVVLPVYRTERLDEIWRVWNRKYDGFAKHANVAFDLHLYHCFGVWWQRQGLQSQLRMTRRHRKVLRRVPAVVGEWSLALAPRARAGDDAEDENEALRAFAAAQLEAYSQASHGWFFWNWRDGPAQDPGWDVRTCVERGWLTKEQLAAAVAAAPGCPAKGG